MRDGGHYIKRKRPGERVERQAANLFTISSLQVLGWPRRLLKDNEGALILRIGRVVGSSRALSANSSETR